jgi:hypothetical protein
MCAQQIIAKGLSLLQRHHVAISLVVDFLRSFQHCAALCCCDTEIVRAGFV